MFNIFICLTFNIFRLRPINDEMKRRRLLEENVEIFEFSGGSSFASRIFLNYFGFLPDFSRVLFLLLLFAIIQFSECEDDLNLMRIETKLTTDKSFYERWMSLITLQVFSYKFYKNNFL